MDRLTLPWEKPHPLDAAYLRHERGSKHLGDVQTAYDGFRVLHEGRSSVYGQPLAYKDPDTGEWHALAWYATAPLAMTLAMSEMVYNLKVALDYAIYALFEQALGDGRINRSSFATPKEFDLFEKSVQFPIMDTPQKAQTWRMKRGYWLNLPEWAEIESAQPYRRQFMRYLGDEYHNLDKHRGLRPLTVDLDFSAASFRDTGATTLGDDFQAKPLPAEVPVYVYANCAVEVTLDGRTPVIETLKVLESEVGALINALALAF